jgi:ubiquitin C
LGADGICRYWLPSLLKHEYVALRFVAQSSYEKAAQMRISPTPDVVTRVFMLFRGVSPDDLGFWAPAAARATAEDGATFWTEIVGVDAMRASDRTLFRVLEWGGMEVE